MTTTRTDGANYEIAEAIAPTSERRRADIEKVATPVREWKLRELRPRLGDTVLELAAGVGDAPGFDAAAMAGGQGRLISTDFSPSMIEAAPGIFSMANAGRTAALLHGAGFDDVRTEELGGRFVMPNVDEYLSVIADTAGPIELTLRGLSDAERADVRTELQDSFARFAAVDGYELPCVALDTVAS
jgi:hypothetical protein